MKPFVTLLITILIITNGAYASDMSEKFSLDKNHTLVGFNVSYLLLGQVSGRFDNFEGSFVIDPIAPESSNADILIQTASVNTGSEARDKKIRGPSLFNAAVHPSMSFHSDKIEMETNNAGQITGNLTLLGITKPITLNLLKMPAKDKGLTSGYQVSGEIKRSDFGMNGFSIPVGNTVALLICYNTKSCKGQNERSEKDF